MTIKDYHRKVTCRLLGHKWLPAGKVLMVCERCKIDNAPPQMPTVPAPYSTPSRRFGSDLIPAPPGHRCLFHWRRYGGSGPWTACIKHNNHTDRHEDGNMSWVSYDYAGSLPHYWGPTDVFREHTL